MIYAMKYLRGEHESFETKQYDTAAVAPYEEEIEQIIRKRHLDASEDWKAFGEKLSGQTIEPFDLEKYQSEYTDAAPEQKDGTYLGQFLIAALAQKSMVTNQIFQTGSRLAGYSINYRKKGLKGVKAYHKLLEQTKGGEDS